MTHAFQVAPSGSTVYVRSGNYPAEALHGPYATPPRLTDYLTFKPYGYDSGTPDDVTIAGLSIGNTGYVRIEGFHLVGNDTTSDVPAADVFNSPNVQLLNNDVTGQGIETQAARNVLIQDNYVHDTTYNCTINSQLDGSGIYLTGPGDNIQLIGNRIENNAADAIDVGDLTNVVIQSNDVSTGPDPTGSQACGYHVDEIQIENKALGPITVVDNVFHDGTQFILRNATGLTIENNLILRIDNWMELMADPGARIINNTWWGGNQVNTGAGSIFLQEWAPGSSWTAAPFNYTNEMDGTILENNIMNKLGEDNVPTTQYHEDYNLLYAPANLDSGIEGPHTHFATPVFVDPTGGDYHLASGSPGIDAGDLTVAPATDLTGVAPWDGHANIGALEQEPPPGATNPPPAPPVADASMGSPLGPVGGRITSVTAKLVSPPPLLMRVSRPAQHGQTLRLSVGCNLHCQVTITGLILLPGTARGWGASKAKALRLRRVRVSASVLRRALLRIRLPRRGAKTKTIAGNATNRQRAKVILYLIARAGSRTTSKTVTFQVLVH